MTREGDMILKNAIRLIKIFMVIIYNKLKRMRIINKID